MDKLISFFIEVGKLKRMKRRGWILRKVKDAETIAEHTFRMTLMAWVLGENKKLKTERILKMALIHDLCEIYAGDTTPYDSLLAGKTEDEVKKLVTKWPGFLKTEKETLLKKKNEKERKALEKITQDISPYLKQEIFSLWEDYEKGTTREGRFLRQLDRIESLLQALEYWQKDKTFPIGPWWIQLRELVDDPVLMKFLESLAHYFKNK